MASSSSGEGGPLAIIRIFLGTDPVLEKLGYQGSTKTLMIEQSTTFEQLRFDLHVKLTKGMEAENTALLNSSWNDYTFRVVDQKDDGNVATPLSLSTVAGDQDCGRVPQDSETVWSVTQTSARPTIHFGVRQQVSTVKRSKKKSKKRLFGKNKSLPGPVGSKGGIFGSKLINLCTWAGYTWMLPAWLLDSIDLLIANTDMVGLFRISAMKTELDELRQAIELGQPLHLADRSIHAVAGVLKMFLHEMPTSLFPSPLVAILEEISEWDESPQKDEAIKCVVYSLPEPAKTFWLRLNQMFRAILERQHLNKMTADNLAVVFSPAIFHARHPIDDLAAVSLVMSHQRIASAIISAAASLSIPPRNMPYMWARDGPAPTAALLILSKLEAGRSTGIVAATGAACPLQMSDSQLVELFRCENAPPPLRMRRSTIIAPPPGRHAQSDKEVAIINTCDSLLQLCARFQARLTELQGGECDLELSSELSRLERTFNELSRDQLGGSYSPPHSPPVSPPLSPHQSPSLILSPIPSPVVTAPTLFNSLASSSPVVVAPRPLQHSLSNSVMIPRTPRASTPPPAGSPKISRPVHSRSKSPALTSSKPLIPPPSLFTPTLYNAEARGRSFH